MNVLSLPLCLQHLNGLYEGVWELLQFINCLDFIEFILLLNSLQATPSLYNRGARWVFTSTLANDLSNFSISI